MSAMQSQDTIINPNNLTVTSSKEKISPPSDPGSQPLNPNDQRCEVAAAAGNDDQKADKVAKVSAFATYWRLLSFTSTADRIVFVCAILAACGSGAALPMMSLIFGDFTNVTTTFIQQGDNAAEYRRELNRTTLWFVYLFIGKVTTSYIFMHGFNHVSINISRRLRTACLKATLNQDLTFFDKNGPGTIAVRLTTDANHVKTGLSEKFGIALRSIAVMITALIIALTANWKLALVSFSGLPAIFLILGCVVTPEARINHRQLELHTKAAEVAEETFSSMRNVLAFNASAKLEKKYNDWLLAGQKEGLKKSWLMSVLWSSEYFSSYSIVALTIFYGMKLLAGGEISGPGGIIVVQFTVVMVVQTLNALLMQVAVFAKATSSARTIFDIIDREPEIALEADGRHTPESLQGDITLRNIDFRYPTRPAAQVLHSLSLNFPAGKVTALVGPSGSGKSTIVGLVERWYDPERGTVYLDGVDIKSLNLQWLRQQIGIVQQEPVLFNDTVFNNVANGLIGTPYENLPVSEKQQLVEAACVKANAHDFITRLGNGYDTSVGDRAGLLSGGQKQRIAIARSIVSNPRILILDEATSALDASSEDIVQDALDKAAEGRTTIVIAHKLATVRNADNIVVLDQGQMVEQGTHDYLVALGGIYSQLASVQDLGAVDVIHSNDKPKDADIERQKSSLDPDSEKECVPRPEFVDVDLENNVGSNKDDNKDSTKKPMISLIGCLYILFGEQPTIIQVRFAVTFLACMLAGLTYMGEALIFGKFIQLFEDQDYDLAEGGQLIGLFFFILALGNLLCYAVVAYQANVLDQHLTRQYRYEFFSNTMKQDLAYFDQEGHSSGALSSKITQSAADLQNLLGLNVAIILLTCVSVLSTTILPLIVGWKLALVSIFGTLPLIFLAGYFQMQIDMSLHEKTSALFSDSAGFAAEAIAAIKTVNALTMESVVLQKYEERMEGIQKKALRTSWSSMALYAVSDSISLLGMGLVFWYGGRLMTAGEYTAYQFFVIIMCVVFGGQASGQIFGFTTDMNKGHRSANELINIRKSVPAINGSTGAEPYNDDDGKIAFNNVTFEYPTRPGVTTLDGISLDIPSGRFIALVGGSGSGKSTVVALLERFYDIRAGEIIVNGQELRKLDPWKHRKRLALVQQEPTLYQGTLKENIALGSNDAVTEEDIVAACKQANIWEFIISLPEGLSTLVGSRGGSLSGGQKQRVAIARALIRKPDVLLLDEATSALDTNSEMIVQAALMEAAKSRTTIAVAHRLSTIVRADCIFVIENGKVVESGKHEELKALGGKYAKLVLMQALDHSG